MNDNGEDSIAFESGPEVISGEWGYACVEPTAVFIPAVMATTDWPLRRVLAHLFARTGQRRMIFSAVLDADGLRPRLRNIVREWDEWYAEMEGYSHCIEILYEPPQSVDAGDPSVADPGTPTPRETTSSSSGAPVTDPAPPPEAPRCP